jgi:hypothetical protein
MRRTTRAGKGKGHRVWGERHLAIDYQLFSLHFQANRQLPTASRFNILDRIII